MKTKTPYISVGQVVKLMENWAPAWTAESWDQVGLATGDPKSKVKRIWVALDFTKDLLDQAIKSDVQMLMLHHPPIFKPLTNLCVDKPATARIVKAAAHGLAVFAAHTNLDSASQGVNDALANVLGLSEVSLLTKAQTGLAKLVTFVPPQYLEPVKEALFRAGAGEIGQYKECAFIQKGEGTFLVPENGTPFVGNIGTRNTVQEIKLETVIPSSRKQSIITALKQVHPYEKVAYDVIGLDQGPEDCGLGRIGNLKSPMKGRDFLEFAAQKLGATSPRFAGPIPKTVEKVAVLGGSGGDFLPFAHQAGAQVLVTGEAGYHLAEQAEDMGVCLLVLGHFQTEQVIVGPWAKRLAFLIKEKGYDVEVAPWTLGRDPWRPLFER